MTHTPAQTFLATGGDRAKNISGLSLSFDFEIMFEENADTAYCIDAPTFTPAGSSILIGDDVHSTKSFWKWGAA